MLLCSRDSYPTQQYAFLHSATGLSKDEVLRVALPEVEALKARGSSTDLTCLQLLHTVIKSSFHLCRTYTRAPPETEDRSFDSLAGMIYGKIEN